MRRRFFIGERVEAALELKPGAHFFPILNARGGSCCNLFDGEHLALNRVRAPSSSLFLSQVVLTFHFLFERLMIIN
jgi:hypothetical protein